MAENEFHLKDGWFIIKEDDGAVRIEKRWKDLWKVDIPPGEEMSVILTPDEWASAVAFVSEQNEDKTVNIEVIKGVEGDCLSVNDYRVAGSKPWGGGEVIFKGKAKKENLIKAIFNHLGKG